jgi:phosphotransferase system HPr (HPr) family protein
MYDLIHTYNMKFFVFQLIRGMMKEITLTIKHEHGLHARPAAMFVETASKFKSGIYVRNATANSGTVNAKSILGVLTLGVHCGHDVQVVADGPDEQEALMAISTLVESNFTDKKTQESSILE